MNTAEGVIKYQLHHVDQAVAKDFPLAELNAWRSVMMKLDLIGQDPARYHGYGFGNLSQRIEPGSPQFIVSGTQTGHLSQLRRMDYCLITQADLAGNQIYAQGLCKPSSEALTHASVYLQDANTNAVIHVHSAEIWRNTQPLKLAHTAADVAYGTPEMAIAVADLFKTQSWQQTTVFTLLGHEDGVIAFGASLAEAGQALIQQLALALAIE